MKLSINEIETELHAVTEQLLKETHGSINREIKPTASLQRHLGIDSLGRAELFERIEKNFSVTLPDRLLAEADNLQDIANYLSTADLIVVDFKKKARADHVQKQNMRLDPQQFRSLNDILLTYAEKSPDKTHILFQHENGQEQVITYGDVLASAAEVAKGLRARGLKAKETVAIMLPTHPDFFAAFFGVLLAGGIPVPIYPPFRMHMLEAYAKLEARILNNAEVRMLITFNEAMKLSQLIKSFVPSMRVVGTVSDLKQAGGKEELFNANTDDYAFIQYTSGSTNDPKGVTLTHGNLLANIKGYGDAIAVNADDVAVSWLPLYHDMGLIGMWLGSLYHGVPLVLLTPFSFLNHPERWLWAIHYHRGTLSGGPNFAYELCARKISTEKLEGLDLSSWRMAANGAEKVYPNTLKQFADRFAPYGLQSDILLPVYGLAESSVALAIPPIKTPYRVDNVDRAQFESENHAVPCEPTANNSLQFVGCGAPIKDHEIRIVNDDNQLLDDRHVGNVQFRGPSAMQGYYNNPTASAAILHDGWWGTGDLAYMAEGQIFITGRKKDLIIKAGRNLYPAEIEEIVGRVAGVRQGCVTAFEVTDEKRATEQLVVVAETRETDKAIRDEIIHHIKRTIAEHLDLAADEVVLAPPHSIPKTSSGKLQRALCKKKYLDGQLGKKIHSPYFQIAKLATLMASKKIAGAFAKAARFFYTAYVAIVVLITALPVYIYIHLVSRDGAARACKYWAKFLLLAAFCPQRVKQLSRNLGKPMIYAANHASYVDSMIMLAQLPIETRIVGKKEIFNVPILRTFLKKLGYIALDRADVTKGIEDSKKIEELLRAGQSILIFPEGTFGYAVGLRPFRSGSFKVAAETQTPVCPVAISGSRYMLREGDKLMRPHRIDITFCTPIKPAGSDWQDINILRNQVRQAVAEYCGEPSLDYIAAETVAPKNRH